MGPVKQIRAQIGESTSDYSREKLNGGNEDPKQRFGIFD